MPAGELTGGDVDERGPDAAKGLRRRAERVTTRVPDEVLGRRTSAGHPANGGPPNRCTPAESHVTQVLVLRTSVAGDGSMCLHFALTRRSSAESIGRPGPRRPPIGRIPGRQPWAIEVLRAREAGLHRLAPSPPGWGGTGLRRRPGDGRRYPPRRTSGARRRVSASRWEIARPCHAGVWPRARRRSD